ncbi:hypothetical protein [Mucilaginibacter aquariorum]|uniref:Uncharacterized protein n=1 Tax=Mucilaginibacter aquariorum TaxID=2967225 RepID=A0ABT1T1D4_9SPHI|nr:hypothetical protein [Mucilaginibacter aquariorum]MCQ6958327.1 hypothetical protein [Mucilaginibacter aquariorum]
MENPEQKCWFKASLQPSWSTKLHFITPRKAASGFDSCPELPAQYPLPIRAEFEPLF